MKTLAEHLIKQSKEICEMNGCTEDNHNCESYAYITKDMQLLDICCPDYFQGTSKLHAAVCLPWAGTQEELEAEVDSQCWDQDEELEYYINLDERGEFSADVRRNGETIFEISGFEIFEDGFMKHNKDLAGLLEYLQSLGIAKKDETLVKGNQP